MTMILFVLIVICIPIIKALFPVGFYASHDGAYHLVRLIHFYQELVRGQYPVRMGFELAYGYGYPVFNYVYPLANIFGSGFHFIGFDYGTSLKLVIGLATVLSIFFYYRWLRDEFNVWTALVGTFLSAYIPYRLVAMYVSGSVGIVLSFLFLPMILWSINRLVKNGGSGGWMVIGVAGLILSHNVSVLIYLPFIGLYTLTLLKKYNLNFRRIVVLFPPVVLGLGISAFFWVPAILEMKNVNLSTGIAVNYLDHFRSLRQFLYSPWNYGYSDGTNGGMSFQVGITQWLVGIISILVVIKLLIKRKLVKKENSVVLSFILMFILTIFIMLPISIPVWKSFPLIQQVQFPWRFLALFIPIGAYLASWCVQKTKWWLGVFLILLAFYGNRNHLRTWEVVRYSDSFYINQPNLFYGSTDIAWETLPIWAKGKIPFGQTKTPIKEVVGSFGYVEEQTKDQERFRLLTKSGEEQKVVFNLFYFPNWQVLVDRQRTEVKPDSEGLLTTIVPPGEHELVVKYASTLTQKIADWVSMVSFLVFVGFLWLRRAILLRLHSNSPRKI